MLTKKGIEKKIKEVHNTVKNLHEYAIKELQKTKNPFWQGAAGAYAGVRGILDILEEEIEAPFKVER